MADDLPPASNLETILGIDPKTGRDELIERHGLGWELFEEFWNEKGYEKPCNICGKTTWIFRVGDIGDGNRVLPWLQMNVPLGFSPAPRFVSADCDNCGNVRMVYKQAIDKWLDKRG